MTAADFKHRRLDLGLTQRELAEILHLTWVTISRYENGHSPVPRAVEIVLSTLKPKEVSS